MAKLQAHRFVELVIFKNIRIKAEGANATARVLEQIKALLAWARQRTGCSTAQTC